jgi:hypothetical protein
VVYHDEDFLYEGDKQQKDCQWFVSGQGCEDGNKCILFHPKWDTALKENKGRCFVCGQKNDHTSMYCTRPGGAYEGVEVAMDLGEYLMTRELPRRPNGEQVFLPQQRQRGRGQNQEERPSGSEAPRSVWPETPEEKEAKQIRRLIEQARKDLIARVSISQNLGEVLTNLAKRTDDFAGKAEVQEIYQAMLIQERIEAIQRNITESHNVDLLRRLHEQRLETVQLQHEEEEGTPQPRPRINAIKVVKVDVEEEEESDSTWLMKFLLTISAQVIVQFLYGSCSKRRKDQKEKTAEEESKTGGGDESIEEDDEADEFELIQQEGTEEDSEEAPQQSEARGSQDDPKDRRCESKEEGRILFVTKYGEVYHLQEDCEKTKGYVKYQRFPCRDCKGQSKEVIRMIHNSRENREETVLYVTPKDQCYHHPTCPKMMKWKYKSKRVRCIICEEKELKGQKIRGETKPES